MVRTRRANCIWFAVCPGKIVAQPIQRSSPDHDADVVPAPPCQRKRLSVEASSPTNSDQHSHGKHDLVDAPIICRPACRRAPRGESVAEENEPQAMPQHPDGPQQECPKRETVAHEHEPIRIGYGLRLCSWRNM